AALDEQLASAPEPPDVGRPRLWVDRVFTISGAGTVVTGTLTGGRFTTRDEVDIAPEGRRARIRKIQSHKKEATEIGPGNRVALNLAGLERQGAERGDAVALPGQWRATDLVGAWIRVLPRSLVGDHTVTEKGAHLMYVGSAETPVTIRLLGADALPAGEEGFALLYLRDALPLQRGDRFVLRDAGRVLTFGGGVILDPATDRRKGHSAEKLDLLRLLHGAPDDEALDALLTHEGSMSLEDAAFRAGTTGSAKVTRLAETLMSRNEIALLRNEVRSSLEEHHRLHPLERGLDREALRSRLGLDGATFDALLRLQEDLTEEGNTVRLTTHTVAFAPDLQEQRQTLLDRIGEGRFSPPLTKDLGADASFLRALEDADDLVRVGDFYLTSERAREARELVRSAIGDSGPKTVAEIRDLLGTTRKYAVPLCEWLDATGATVRSGDVRLLGPRP
ncbi:MAG TPA: SelB C-terminal domain-containing protein, partial [Actinomycetota bacterium]|nr:SelB C-terminal domain-containing protein [Actinomycetota bacterium]